MTRNITLVATDRLDFRCILPGAILGGNAGLVENRVSVAISTLERPAYPPPVRRFPW